MTDKHRFDDECSDWHDDELRVPKNFDPPSERLKKRLAELAEQFRTGLLDTRDFGKLDEKLYGLAQWRDSGELSDHDFVVEMLQMLNDYAEPLTHDLLKSYGISEFSLTQQDFDRVCLDFLSSKHGERMIIDPDSIPEELDELPMNINEIGNSLRGTLKKERDRWYVESKDQRWFPMASNLSVEELEANAGKKSTQKSARAKRGNLWSWSE